jgi:hypothetical protein
VSLFSGDGDSTRKQILCRKFIKGQWSLVFPLAVIDQSAADNGIIFSESFGAKTASGLEIINEADGVIARISTASVVSDILQAWAGGMDKCLGLKYNE